jgi:hypothetical protein
MDFWAELLALFWKSDREYSSDGLSRLTLMTGTACLAIASGLLTWVWMGNSVDETNVVLWFVAVLLGGFTGPGAVAVVARRRWKLYYPLWLVLLVIVSGPVGILIWRLFFHLLGKSAP